MSTHTPATLIMDQTSAAKGEDMGKVTIPTVPTSEGTSNRTEESLSALQVLELLPSDCCSSDTEDDRRSDDERRKGARPNRHLAASKTTATTTRQRNSGERQRLLEATALLRQVVRDKGVLDAELSEKERKDLVDATGAVFFGHPEHQRRSRSVANKRAADQQLLKNTGIRRLRNQPRYATPSPLNLVPLPSTPSVTPKTKNSTGHDGVHGEKEEEDNHREKQCEGVSVSTTTECKRKCYVCKAHYTSIHHFYDQLCPDNGMCAPLNFRKRGELADLSGKVALLTGGRIKIGYQAAIKLLRCGTRVIVTTRFPRDAAARYATEPDFKVWGSRLEIFGLDLRHTPSVEAFCGFVLDRYPRLDFIVNNAAQTIRRPPCFYQHMLAAEKAPLATLDPKIRQLLSAYEVLLSSPPFRGVNDPPKASKALPPPHHHQALGDSPTSSSEGLATTMEAPSSVSSSVVVSPSPSRLSRPAELSQIGLTRPAELSQLPLLQEDFDLSGASASSVFPVGRTDQDMQQVDLRDTNSWLLELHQVSTIELLETQLVNAVAPFVINARLKPLMEASPGAHKHIVNVSAMEGQFYRKNKTTRHPHTNMAKAALNMMTRTSAPQYITSGIHMNSVDTGWVTDENPTGANLNNSGSTMGGRADDDDRSFQPPLDIVDGAARILDPIIDGANTGNHVWGQFLKDYKPTDW